MTTFRIVESAELYFDHALLMRGDEAWLTFVAPWWAIHRWVWWVLTPGAKAFVVLTKDGKSVRVRSVRIARRMIRMGTP